MPDGELKEEAGADITEKKGRHSTTAGLLSLYKSPPFGTTPQEKTNALPLRVESEPVPCWGEPYHACCGDEGGMGRDGSLAMIARG